MELLAIRNCNINKLVIYSYDKQNNSIYYGVCLLKKIRKELNNKYYIFDTSFKLNTNCEYYIKGFYEDDTNLNLIVSQKININNLLNDHINNIIKIDMNYIDRPINEKKDKKNVILYEQFHNYEEINKQTIPLFIKLNNSDNKLNKINLFDLKEPIIYIPDKKIVCIKNQTIDIDNLKIVNYIFSKKDIINFVLLRYLKKTATINDFIKDHKIDITPLKNKKINNIEEFLGGVQLKKYRKLELDKYDNTRLFSIIDSSVIFYKNNIDILCDNNKINLKKLFKFNFKNSYCISFNVSLQNLRRIYQPYTAKLYNITTTKLCNDFNIVIFHYINKYHNPKSHIERDYGAMLYGHTRLNTCPSCDKLSDKLPNKTLKFKIIFISPVNRATIVTKFDMDNFNQRWIKAGEDLGFIGLTVSNIIMISNKEIKPIDDLKISKYYDNKYMIPSNIKSKKYIGNIL